MIDETQLVFDADEVCRWYDNDYEAIQELTGLVCNDLPGYVRTLEQAAEAGDLQAVGRAAHTIKGAVGNVCALRLAGVTEALEIAARSNDAARVAALRPVFRANAAALVDALSSWARSLPRVSVSGRETAA